MVGPPPQGRGPAWWARLLHSVGWLPGSRPPGLAGGSLGLALRGRGMSRNITGVCGSTQSCRRLSGWGERSSALSHPGMMGCLTFLLIRRHGWLPGSQDPGNRVWGKGHFLIHGSRMSPLLVISSLHPFSSTPRGQACKLRAELPYDEINSVSLSKRLVGVSDVTG